ncbi:MAG: hypothetical protein KDK56_04540 [Simkania sp.]|nr:hypothetical protein [Simkania sp.]MCB1075710.1 hypothetical protein [Simkania sp.]MCP5490064.1 hypothetical protein [Chlamydiales bacterium]
MAVYRREGDLSSYTPFNQVDQTLSYQDPQGSHELDGSPPRDDYGTIQHTFTSHPPLGFSDEVSFSLPPPSNNKNRTVVAVTSILSMAAAISGLALIIFGHFGLRFDATTGVGIGFFSFFSIVVLLSRKVGDAIKDRLLQFAPFAYFYVTNTDLNIPVDHHFFSHLTAGILLSILGSQLSAQLHNIVNWSIEDDLVSQKDSELPLLTPPQSRGTPIITDHRIRVFTSQKETLGKIELKAAQIRCIQLALQGALGLGVMIAGYTTSAAITLAAIKVGTLIFGSALGGFLHEGVRAGTRYYERKGESDGQPSLGLRFFRLVGKAEMVAGALFVGLVGINKWYVTLFAACCFGIKRQIEWIRFIRTPVAKLTELRLHDSDHMRTTCTLVCLVGLAVLWIGFYCWQMAVGPTTEQSALSTYTWMAFLWGAAAVMIDRHYDILNEHSRLLNTLFFHLRYSTAPPIYFIGITQVMRIGSEALTGYTFLLNFLACIAWADLGSAFGSHAATMLTKRDTKYPANLNSLFAIFIYYYSQLIFGVASNGTGE